MKRRRFLQLCAFSGMVVGCADSTSPERPRSFTINLKVPLAEGDTHLPLDRLVLRKEGDRITGLSLVCPHQNCLVASNDAQGFTCPCHGARFDHAGKVLQGPATRDLAQITVQELDSLTLLVTYPAVDRSLS